MRAGKVDVVLFGADRVAANGDTVNKIGRLPFFLSYNAYHSSSHSHLLPRFAHLCLSFWSCRHNSHLRCFATGSYNLSVLAKENGVPVYSVVPTSTIDLTISSGDDIVIEERKAEEVTDLRFMGEAAAPAGVPVYNPAFDCTPHRYLTGIITEEGICYPPFEKSLAEAKRAAEARIKASWSEK